MPFQFTCPYCFTKTLVDDKYAGQTGPCATCGKVVTLPASNSLARNSIKRSSASLYVAGENSSTTVESDCDLPSVSQKLGNDEFADAETSKSPFEATASVRPIPPVVVSRVEGHDPELARKMRRRKLWIAGGALVSFCVFGFVAYSLVSLLFSSSFIQDMQARRDRAKCMNNLQKIALALNEYAATNGTYPPAVIYDDKGKPMHSWRVLILRELGEAALYNRYRFDEPWDSEHNSALVGSCPETYVSPSVGISGESNYFIVSGGNTIFPDGAALAPHNITDGKDMTILLVEAQNMIHEWTKPIDVTAGGKTAIKMGGNHQGGFTAVTADGTPLWIPDDTPQELIDSMITPSGGETVDAKVFAH